MAINNATVTGLPFVPDDDEIIAVSHSTDDATIIRLIESNVYKAAVIPPPDRAKFLESVPDAQTGRHILKELNLQNLELTRNLSSGNIADIFQRTGGGSAPACTSDLEEILSGPLGERIQKMVDITASTKTFAFHGDSAYFGQFASDGTASKSPAFHVDPLTVHLSLAGTGLEFIAGPQPRQKSIELNRYYALEVGDIVVFNNRFVHKKPC